MTHILHVTNRFDWFVEEAKLTLSSNICETKAQKLYELIDNKDPFRLIKELPKEGVVWKVIKDNKVSLLMTSKENKGHFSTLTVKEVQGYFKGDTVSAYETTIIHVNQKGEILQEIKEKVRANKALASIRKFHEEFNH